MLSLSPSPLSLCVRVCVSLLLPCGEDFSLAAIASLLSQWVYTAVAPPAPRSCSAVGGGVVRSSSSSRALPLSLQINTRSLSLPGMDDGCTQTWHCDITPSTSASLRQVRRAVAADEYSRCTQVTVRASGISLLASTCCPSTL